MTEATEKQINFAKQLGIKNPENFTKEALKPMIDEKLKERDAGKQKAQPEPSKAQNNTILSQIVITRTEKPHSYEWGRPSARHKVYYSEVSELKEHIRILEEAGFLDDIVETQKIE